MRGAIVAALLLVACGSGAARAEGNADGAPAAPAAPAAIRAGAMCLPPAAASLRFFECPGPAFERLVELGTRWRVDTALTACRSIVAVLSERSGFPADSFALVYASYNFGGEFPLRTASGEGLLLRMERPLMAGRTTIGLFALSDSVADSLGSDVVMDDDETLFQGLRIDGVPYVLAIHAPALARAGEEMTGYLARIQRAFREDVMAFSVSPTRYLRFLPPGSTSSGGPPSVGD